jgi:hypothetical protein
MRICKICGVNKPLTEYKRVGPNRVHMWNCLSCYTDNRRNNKRNMLSKMDADLRRRYNITEANYYEMLEKQDYKCATCKSSDPIGYRGSDKFCVDHDHSTGEVRGLLCNHCNRALGLVRDNRQTLQNMLQYLDN